MLLITFLVIGIITKGQLEVCSPKTVGPVGSTSRTALLNVCEYLMDKYVYYGQSYRHSVRGLVAKHTLNVLYIWG